MESDGEEVKCTWSEEYDNICSFISCIYRHAVWWSLL